MLSRSTATQCDNFHGESFMTKFYRSTKDKKLAGICGALGEIYNIDSNLIRILLVVLALATTILPLFIVYLAAWVILPEDIYANNE
jgi:phage shock protein C